MNDKNDQVSIIVGTLGVALVSGLAVFSIAIAYQDGYKAGIKDSPGTVNISGDQIITNTSTSLSPGSGNGTKTETTKE